jgi:hypothetical protein
MHLDDEQLQRTLHRELGGDEPPVREHLIACVECRSRLAEAERDERWVLDRLRVLDHALPPVGLERIMAPTSARAPVWHRVAAGIVLLLAVAGVAYAAPGSPLPRMVERLVGMLYPRQARVAPRQPTDAVPSQAGIAVDPGSRLTIVFSGEQPDGLAIVSLSDSGDAIVRAAGGTTTFTSDIDRVTIEHSGAPATIDILIPRHAPRVEIFAGERRIFLKQDARIVTLTPRGTDGRYRLPLSAARP